MAEALPGILRQLAHPPVGVGRGRAGQGGDSGSVIPAGCRRRRRRAAWPFPPRGVRAPTDAGRLNGGLAGILKHTRESDKLEHKIQHKAAARYEARRLPVLLLSETNKLLLHSILMHVIL